MQLAPKILTGLGSSSKPKQNAAEKKIGTAPKNKQDGRTGTFSEIVDVVLDRRGRLEENSYKPHSMVYNCQHQLILWARLLWYVGRLGRFRWWGVGSGEGACAVESAPFWLFCEGFGVDSGDF